MTSFAQSRITGILGIDFNSSMNNLEMYSEYGAIHQFSIVVVII